jgi:hypothetical protein
MYLQEILEVAIGLVFMWLVISLAAMQFQEWIANLFKWRAKGMEDSIRSMLGGEQGGQALTDILYKHPLIASLSSRTHKKLSYIPASKFALALFDIVMTAGTEAWPVKHALEDVKAQVASISNPEQKKLATEDFEALLATAKQIAGTHLGDAAVDSLKMQIQNYGEKYPELKPAIDLALPQIDSYYQKLTEEQRKAPPAGQDKDLTLHQLRLGLLAMDTVYPNAKKSLSALLTGAEEYVKEGEQALATGRKNVETWFNDSMDRLTGWYKRKAQFVAFMIGLVLALLLNVDSINIATSLWREPTLRQAIVAQADTYVQQYQETPTPTETPIPGAVAETPVTGTPTQTAVDPAKAISDLQKKLTVLNIPFGWTLTPFDTGGKQCTLIPTNASQVFGFSGKNELGEPACKYVSNFPKDWSSGLSKIAGLLMSAAASAQGAPFWFDILKKLINVRSSGPNPAEKEGQAAG